MRMVRPAEGTRRSEKPSGAIPCCAWRSTEASAGHLTRGGWHAQPQARDVPTASISGPAAGRCRAPTLQNAPRTDCGDCPPAAERAPHPAPRTPHGTRSRTARHTADAVRSARCVQPPGRCVSGGLGAEAKEGCNSSPVRPPLVHHRGVLTRRIDSSLGSTQALRVRCGVLVVDRQ